MTRYAKNEQGMRGVSRSKEDQPRIHRVPKAFPSPHRKSCRCLKPQPPAECSAPQLLRVAVVTPSMSSSGRGAGNDARGGAEDPFRSRAKFFGDLSPAHYQVRYCLGRDSANRPLSLQLHSHNLPFCSYEFFVISCHLISFVCCSFSNRSPCIETRRRSTCPQTAVCHNAIM